MEERLYEIYEKDHLLASDVPIDCVEIFVAALLDKWYADPSIEIKIIKCATKIENSGEIISDYV